MKNKNKANKIMEVENQKQGKLTNLLKLNLKRLKLHRTKMQVKRLVWPRKRNSFNI